jgi:hypothetical protein
MGWHIGVWTQQRTFGSGDCPVAATDMQLDGQTQPEPPVRYHQKPQSPSFASARWGANPLPSRSIHAPESSRPDETMTMATAVFGSSNHAALV